MADEEKKKTVAYVPFKTFLAAIESLEHGIPHQIDSSVWPTYSGAIKSQLLGAFRFLGFIDESGKPATTLSLLVNDKVNRKALLQKALETSYPKIFQIGLQEMTPKQFDDLMREYGMEGETNKKVVSFFLKAAKYADTPMSNLLGRKTRTSRKRKAASLDASNGDEQAKSTTSLPASGVQGTSRTIELKSGGKLTLILSVNVFDLNSSDRDFVFGMIDKLQDYDRQKETASE